MELRTVFVVVVFVCSFWTLVHPEPTQSESEDTLPYNYQLHTRDAPNPLDGPSRQCTIGTVYEQSIPTGKTTVDVLIKLGTLSGEQCVRACCREGPSVCQYAWIFEGMCFAVACPSNHSKCAVEHLGLSGTTYIEMAYTGQEDEENEETATMVTTDATPEGEGNSESEERVTDDSDPPVTSTPLESANQTEVIDRPTTEHTDTPVPEILATETAAPVIAETPTPETPAPETAAPVTAAPETPAPEETITEPQQPTPPKTPTLTVGTYGDTDITLPENEVKIFSNVWPDTGEFTYKWEEISGRGKGTLIGKNEKDVTLTELEEGVYELKLTVHNEEMEYGVAYVNVTVHHEPRVNQPPIINISPSNNIVVELPRDQVILDASNTDDDSGKDTLSFLWEEVTGPIDSQKVSEDALLELTDLKKGIYQYKLTVTDQDGAHSVAFSNVTVLPEQDYPPTANAGNPILIHLPTDDVYLYGNGSTDDKGIAKYSWEIVGDNQGGLDLEGSQTSVLHVTHLTLGMHTFKLTVTDTAGHIDTAMVDVDVKEEEFIPPTANAGGNITVVFPKNSVVLRGGKSHDDYRIITFSWEQISGPRDVQLTGADTDSLTVSGLHIDEEVGSPTIYQFELTVVDHRNLNNSDTATVSYYKDPNNPPRVATGPNVQILLPENTAVLNGSQSEDDFGIASYHWSRSDSSPAAGMVVNASDTKPVLMLSNLINGTYNFTLTITNKNDQSATNHVLLRVLPNPHEKDIIEVHLSLPLWNFTKANLDDFGEVLNLALKEDKKNKKTNYKIVFQGVRQHDSHTVVEFYAVDYRSGEVLNATDAYYLLTEEGQDYHLMGFHVIQVEMKVCDLPCSGRGKCDVTTKKCKCDTFWMEDPFKANTGRKETNCQWSVFYVVLVILCAVLLVVIIIWLCCCCCLRKRRVSRSKKRIKYAILDHKENGEEMHMLPKDGSLYQETSLMVSESETEEEVLFDSSKKNHHPPTGNRHSTIRYSSLTNSVVPK